MTQKQKTATVATILSDVLANLAFMFSDDETADPSSGDLWFETTISYRGSFNGTLRFRCPEDFTKLLASNLLGLSPDDEDMGPQGIDATKEFMNIICGQFVTAVHGTKDVYDLTIPEVAVLSEAPTIEPGDKGADISALSVEGHLVELVYLPSGS